MQLFVNVMKPIADGIDTLQKENDVFFGSYLPVLHSIHIELEKMKNGATGNKQLLASKLIGKMEKRFHNELSLNMNVSHIKIAVVATVSHPSLKLIWKMCSYTKIRNAEVYKALFREACLEFTKQKEAKEVVSSGNDNAFYEYCEEGSDTGTDMVDLSYINL